MVGLERKYTMKDYINIGCSPAEEDCAQVGQHDYHEQARKQCIAFRNQLRRQFGPEPEGARLVIKSFPHDFGSYMEVVCEYEETFEEEESPSVDYAFKLESDMPLEWDMEARKELGINIGVTNPHLDQIKIIE